MFCRMDHTKVVPLEAFLRKTSVRYRWIFALLMDFRAIDGFSCYGLCAIDGICTSRTYSVMLRVALLTIETPESPIIREFQKSGLPKCFQSEPKCKRWNFEISSFYFCRSHSVLFLLISLLLHRRT